MKKSEINIRINSFLKEDFKKICDDSNISMSEKIIEYIERDVSNSKSLKISLLRKIIEPYLLDNLFSEQDNFIDELKGYIKGLISFDFVLSELTVENNIWSGEIFVNDNNKKHILTYKITKNE